MKWLLIVVIVIVGIFALFVTVAVSPMERNLSEAANQSAVDVMGSNYSQFSGVPELLKYWWMLPIFVMAILMMYGAYKVYKGRS
jgi:hypothetical protein